MSGASRSLRRRPASPAALALSAVAAVAAVWVGPQLAGPDSYPLLTSWAAYAVLALSLAWVWGKVGIFSFGQPLFFGLGAYAFGAASINLASSSSRTIAALAVATLVGGAVAGLLGYFMFYGRVSNLAVGIITFAATLTTQTLVTATSGGSWTIGTAAIGGENGMTPIPLPTLPGVGELDPVQLYWLNGLCAVAVLLLLGVLARRPMGRIGAGVRENEERSELLGYDVRWEKLRAFVVGGLVAGFGGGLFAGWSGIAYPSVFSLSQMALVVVWVLVGGRGSLVGPFAAVFLIQWLNDRLAGGSSLPSGTSQLILGAVMVLFVVLLPGGVASAVRRLAAWAGSRRRVSDSPADEEEAIPHGALADLSLGAAEPAAPLRLEVHALERTFGRLRAVDGLELSFAGPSLYPIVGPNGAGKSTFFGLLMGRVMPTSGTIRLDGRSLAGEPVFRRARDGMGGKLQQPSIFPELAVAENLWLAAYSVERSAARADARVAEALPRFGLAAQAGRPAGELAHGQQQWLEIAMVLARDPRLVLLDEPTAGMSLTEARAMAAIVKQLATTRCVIVVAHDMRFVAELGQVVTVLHNGRVFARQPLEQLREHDEFLDIYLGRAANA